MNSIGIDFGTGNSVLSGWLAGKPQIFIPKGSSTPNLSSDLLVTEGNQIETDPSWLNNPPEGYKRVTGIKRRLLDLEKEPLEQRDLLIKLAEKRIGFLYEAFRKEQNDEVVKAVLTCPANSSRAYRDLLHEIGQRVGLPRVEIVDEPTAAGVHHGLIRPPDRDEKWMVVDWGCGTCDISFILREKGSKDLKVQAIQGDNHLGGMDMDELLRAHLANRYQFAADLCPLWQVEELKKNLSESESIEHPLTLSNGKVILVTITRAELEALIQPLLNRASALISNGLKEVGWKVLDTVIGTGGPMLMPSVRRTIAETLDEDEEDTKLFHWSDPLTSVAQGAARLAEMKRTGEAYVTSRIKNPIGVRVIKGTNDDAFEEIIHRGEVCPVVDRTKDLTTSVDLQDIIAIELREGLAKSAEANTLLGRLNVVVRPEEKGKIKVRLHLTVSDSTPLNAWVEPLGDAGSVRQVQSAGIRVQRNDTVIETATAVWGDPLEEFEDAIRQSTPDPDTARQIYERLKIKYHPDRRPSEAEKQIAQTRLQAMEQALGEYLDEVRRRMRASTQPELPWEDPAALERIAVDEILAQRLAHCLAFSVPGKGKPDQMVQLIKHYPDYRRVLAAYLFTLGSNPVLQDLLSKDDRPHVGLVVLLQNLPNKPIRERHEVLKAAYRLTDDRVRQLLADENLDMEKLYQTVKTEAPAATNPITGRAQAAQPQGNAQTTTIIENLNYEYSGGNTYITGNTYPVKEILKSLGCRWDGQKKAWYVTGKKLTKEEVIRKANE